MPEEVEVHTNLSTTAEREKGDVTALGGVHGRCGLPGIADPQSERFIKVLLALCRASIVVR